MASGPHEERSLPEEKQKAEKDGEELFTFNGVTYEPTLIDGAIAYEVV